MHSIYDTVLYFVGLKGEEGAKELMQRSVKVVKEIEKGVIAEWEKCLGSKGIKYKIGTIFSTLDEPDKIEIGKALDNNLIHDNIRTKELLLETPYEVIDYLAKRNIKLIYESLQYISKWSCILDVYQFIIAEANGLKLR